MVSRASPEEGFVHLRKVSHVGRQIILHVDRNARAALLADAAICTAFGIDKILVVALPVNSDRTVTDAFLGAGSRAKVVLDTGPGNYVGHNRPLQIV